MPQLSADYPSERVRKHIVWDADDVTETVQCLDTRETLHVASYPLYRLLAPHEMRLDYRCSYIAGRVREYMDCLGVPAGVAR